MPLGQGIGELWEAVRDRIEVSGEDPTWEVTAGSFDSALAYAREAYGDAAVVARRDRDRWWPRVTLTVTSDPRLAAGAPPLAQLARPQLPEQPEQRSPRARHAADAVPPQRRSVPAPAREGRTRDAGTLPSSLEAIFAHQEELRAARRTAEGDSPGGR